MIIKKTVLIVDDSEINRRILEKILSDEFTVLEAQNGQAALDLLKGNIGEIAAVVLDLVMPVMSGYEFLGLVSQTEELSNIPIIVSTGNTEKENEIRALELGAWDFISKPYNARILKFRIKNAISRSQLAAFQQLKYLSEFDILTDIFNKKHMFAATVEMLAHFTKQRFAFVRVDIDRFQLINSYFGKKAGDRLLIHIGSILKKFAVTLEPITYGRMEADVFAMCIPYTSNDRLYDIINVLKKEIKNFSISFDVVPTFGVYIVEDIHEQPDSMLDKANLAARQVKGNYVTNYAIYAPEMSREIEIEQEIINEMSEALAKKQFVVYFQPKYSLQTRKPCGAEALVRWRHPKKGMIPPGDFIPVFESNGFIAQLDHYIWEEVCRYIRRWLDDGKKVSPISVNVSRVNMYNQHLVDELCSLVEKYNVPKELFNLELTESAYTDNPGILMDTMKKLHDNHFTVMMDDFGSGYSSLNILKDIEVDVLKIDMKFLSESSIPGRGENIVASVVRMAKWLNIPTIAEGVEKSEQVEFLSGVGCEYVQGFFFARPMPAEDYEKLAEEATVFVPASIIPRFDTDSLWIANPQMEMLFSNVMQAVAIYEFEDDKIEVIRVNKAFYEMFGYEDILLHCANKLEAVHREHRAALLNAFRVAVSDRSSAECEYLRTCSGNRDIWVHTKLKYIDKVGNKHVLLGSL